MDLFTSDNQIIKTSDKKSPKTYNTNHYSHKKVVQLRTTFIPASTEMRCFYGGKKNHSQHN